MRIWPKLWVPGSPHVLAYESVIWVTSELPEFPRVRMVILISKAVWSLFSYLLCRIFYSANSSGYVDFYSVNGVVGMGVYWTLNHILAGLWQWLVAVFPLSHPLSFYYIFMSLLHLFTAAQLFPEWFYGEKNFLFVVLKLILVYIVGFIWKVHTFHLKIS
jgi:hypothetical protein